MAVTCNAEHPEHPGVFCEYPATQTHEYHRRVLGAGTPHHEVVRWKNEDYVRVDPLMDHLPKSERERMKELANRTSEHSRERARSHPPETRVRRTDPETSQEAAHTLGDLLESQNEVLALLRELGPATDEVFVEFAQQRCQQTPSGLRTRRRELVDHELVEWTGEWRQTRSGKRARVWAVVAQ